MELEPAPVRIPFTFDLPDGYAVAVIDVDLRTPSAAVYIGGADRRSGLPEADLLVTLDATDRLPNRTGEETSINGRPALLNRDRRFPAVWLDERGSWLWLGIAPDDTGPYPDRSGELPVLQGVAGSLTAAPELREPAGWFAAAEVFG